MLVHDDAEFHRVHNRTVLEKGFYENSETFIQKETEGF
jgi:hypothetical protein